MKTLSHVTAVVALITFFAIQDSAAQARPDGNALLWTVYRDASGQLTKQSEEFARKMEKKAAKEGYITLWLTANVTFNPYMGDMTDEEISAQNEMVTKFFESVLQPLLDAGMVWHPKAGANIAGPGCLIRANAAGLVQLVQDRRILHIIEVI